MAPCTHPGTKRLFCPTGKKRSRSLRSLGLASLLVERYMRQGSLIRTCSRPCRFEGKKNDSPSPRKPAAPKTHPPQNAFPLFWKLPIWTCELPCTPKAIRPTYAECATHRAATPPPAEIEGVRLHASTSLWWMLPQHPSGGCLPAYSVSPAMTAGAARCVLSELEKILELDS